MAKKVEITIETAAETDVGELLRRSRRRKREKEIVLLTIKYLALTLMAVFLLFPYVFMVSKSLMDIVDANSSTPDAVPHARGTLQKLRGVFRILEILQKFSHRGRHKRYFYPAYGLYGGLSVCTAQL